MKISELPNGIREKALEYQKQDGKVLETDDLCLAFNWNATVEGLDYWVDLDRAKPTQDVQETLEEAKKQQFKYDNLQDAKEISSRIKVVETLEEAYNKIYKEIDFSEFDFASFAIGVKFQQERSYSEEDMRDYAIFYYTHQGKATKYWGKDLFKEWFKQFKK
jgi:hypothetical protein